MKISELITELEKLSLENIIFTLLTQYEKVAEYKCKNNR